MRWIPAFAGMTTMCCCEALVESFTQTHRSTVIPDLPVTATRFAWTAALRPVEVQGFVPCPVGNLIAEPVRVLTGNALSRPVIPSPRPP